MHKIEYVATSTATKYGPRPDNASAQVYADGRFFGNIYPNPLSAAYMRPGTNSNMCGFTFCAPNGEILSMDLLRSSLDLTVRTLVEMLPAI